MDKLINVNGNQSEKGGKNLNYFLPKFKSLCW